MKLTEAMQRIREYIPSLSYGEEEHLYGILRELESQSFQGTEEEMEIKTISKSEIDAVIKEKEKKDAEFDRDEEEARNQAIELWSRCSETPLFIKFGSAWDSMLLQIKIRDTKPPDCHLLEAFGSGMAPTMYLWKEEKWQR